MILGLNSVIKPPQIDNNPLTQIASPEVPEGCCHIFDQMANQPPQGQTLMLEYPIFDRVANALMKAIPLQNIPTFHGMTTEYLNSFVFEFDFMCRRQEYTTDPQNLKLFPSTLNGAALQWFMGFGGCTINSWDDMKTYFLMKYQDQYRTRELKDGIFKMFCEG